jgi:hypothetical protein
MVDVLEKSAGMVLGIVEQLRNRTIQANGNAPRLTDQHHLLTSTRQKPWEEHGVQVIGPLGPLDTCSEAWIDEEFWLVNK